MDECYLSILSVDIITVCGRFAEVDGGGGRGGCGKITKFIFSTHCTVCKSNKSLKHKIK